MESDQPSVPADEEDAQRQHVRAEKTAGEGQVGRVAQQRKRRGGPRVADEPFREQRPEFVGSFRFSDFCAAARE